MIVEGSGTIGVHVLGGDSVPGMDTWIGGGGGVYFPHALYISDHLSLFTQRDGPKLHQ
jgi:hypothetical protein